MAESITIKALQDASLDAKSLEEVVNGNDAKQVTTRLGENYPSVKNAIKQLFENGGLPATPFSTKALMEASNLEDGAYAVVTDDSDSGLYIKSNGEWVLSNYSQFEVTRGYQQKLAESEAATHIKKSNNLFNHNDYIAGKVISVNGTLDDSINYKTTGFIAVEPNAQYTVSAKNRPESDSLFQPFYITSFYDSQQRFVKRIYTAIDSDTLAHTFTVPNNVYFLRFSYSKGNDFAQGRMFNKGAVALPYEPYKVELSNVVLADDIKSQVNEEHKYFEKSYNLFNPDAVEWGTYYDVNGNLLKNLTSSTSEFIKIKPETDYVFSWTGSHDTLTAFAHTSYFTRDFKFIERKFTTSNEVDGAVVVKSPSNAYYMRAAVNFSDPYEHKRMIAEGSAKKPYQPYKVVLKNRHSGLTEKSSNLLSVEGIMLGCIVWDNGSIVESADYSLSDFIPVEPKADYTLSGGSAELGISPFVSIAYYDIDKKFLSRPYTLANGGVDKVITIPDDAYYVRLNMNRGSPLEHKRMFNKGTIALPYESPAPRLNDVQLSEYTISQVVEKIDTRAINKTILDVPIDGTFQSVKDTWNEDYTDFRNTKHDAVYAMYDSLVQQHPEYITKQVLGDDAWGNTIAMYHFKPQQSDANDKRKLPKIFLTCGTHGYEHASPLATYLLLVQMCDNWQESAELEALRFNLELLVIPVVNPSGWDDYTRWNRNKIDLNRNFPAGFRVVAQNLDTYGGEEALSELESQYVAQVFNEHPDLDAFYDFHNFHGVIREDEPYIWIPTNDRYVVQQLGQALIGRMTRKWKKEYSWIPDNWFSGYASRGASEGIIKDYANSLGINRSATFEVCEVWHIKDGAVPYDDIHCKTSCEAIGNWLLINMMSICG